MDFSERRRVVWVVDDSVLDAERARRALAADYDVSVFADGTAAVERLASSSPPDVLVLDWVMPGLSGIEVCRFVRSMPGETARTPVLMLTAYQQSEQIVEGLSAGANDYVSKPYANEELKARVDTLVRTRLLAEQAADRRAAEAQARALNATLAARVSERTSELESLLSHAPIGFAFFDREGRYLRVNEALASMDGLPVEAHLGRPIAEVLPSHALLVEPVLRRVFETGEAVAQFEVRGETPADPGAERHWLMGFYPVRGADADVVSAGAFVLDITAQKRLEAEREALLESERAARAEAERASRTKDEFVSVVSHELRTPLNSILGWADLLDKPNRKLEDFARGLRVIRRNGQLLNELVSDLLDVSRIASGKLRIDLQPVQLSSIVEAAVETHRPAAEANGVELVVDVAPGVDGLADPGRLQQIVGNLLSNGIKFTPRGGRVTVTLGRRGSNARLTVTDTGQGIDPEFLPRAFTRFRQADASLSREHGGLGLGLSITKHLVEVHGGTIRAESDGIGKGATFTVELPLGKATAAEHEAPPESRVQPIRSVRGLAVLVVDDEQDGREFVRRILEEHGARVVTATSAASALHALASGPPDVLISDIGMPGMDGYALIREIRAHAPIELMDVPAVAVTAFAREEDRVRALAAGYDAHLAKPVDSTALVATIARVAGADAAPAGRSIVR